MKSKRYVCFHFRHIWLPLLYTYLLATLSYADHLLGNPDFDDSVDGRRWSFYRQHRYDIKKPGPTYFLHEPDSNDINLEDIQLNSDFDSISPVYPEGVVQWVPLNENLENENLDENADLLIGEPPNVDENVNIQVPLMGEQELELDSSEDLEKLRSILTLLEDVTGLVYQQQQQQQQLSDQENDNPRDLRFIQSKQDDQQQQQAAYKDDNNNNENDSIQDKAKSLSKKPSDGDESSVKENVNQEEALSLLPLVPTKLIVPKELNLIQDRLDPMAKRFIKSSSSVLPELESPSNQQSLTVITVFICSTVFVALIAGLVLFVSKRNQNLRNKLRNLIGSIGSAEEGNEATSDYEDLCRQRMQGKNRKKSDKDEAKSILKGKTGSLAGGVIGLIGTGGSDSKTGKTGTDSKSIDSGPEPSPPSRSSTSSWSEEPVTSSLDISTGHMILSYMEDHLKNKDRLAKEWEALCAYEVDPCSTTAAMLPQNLTKNRHSDVLPFDHSRVILNDLANKTCSDYINASTITDHDPRSPVYIVTQGPLASTVGDFWQMVWEQGSVIVVMLTRLVENGVNLSARYWPEEGSALHTSFEIHLVSEHIWCEDYLVRSFFLKNAKTNETRTVTQFHYLTWPENGVPSNPRPLLEFRRKVNKSYRGRSCPIVVHCSDGIGRTGTYCLIDMVLNRLAKGAKEIDIAATLEHIRDQRGASVKTKVQFEFVLEAIAEEVSAILKTLKPN